MATILTILKIFKRHLLPNRKSNWTKTWWKASEQYRDSELLKSFRSESKMAGMMAILKIFKPCLFRNSKSVWTKTWWEALGWNGHLDLLDSFCWPLLWPSWKSWNDICYRTISQIKLKLGGRHWEDMETQNCQIRSIPTSKMADTAAILKFFKKTYHFSQILMRIEPKLDRRHRIDIGIQNC